LSSHATSQGLQTIPHNKLSDCFKCLWHAYSEQRLVRAGSSLPVAGLDHEACGPEHSGDAAPMLASPAKYCAHQTKTTWKAHFSPTRLTRAMAQWAPCNSTTKHLMPKHSIGYRTLKRTSAQAQDKHVLLNMLCYLRGRAGPHQNISVVSANTRPTTGADGEMKQPTGEYWGGEKGFNNENKNWSPRWKSALTNIHGSGRRSSLQLARCAH
jgi:hypothetical protein